MTENSTPAMDTKAIQRIYTGKKKYIFVSYAHKDKEQVLKYVRHLIDCGYRVWYDHEISSSTNWLTRISYRLSESYVFMPFFSPNYVASENCMKELEEASNFEKVLIPVYLHPVSFDTHKKLYYSYVERMHARYCERTPGNAGKLKSPAELVQELAYKNKPMKHCRRISMGLKALFALLICAGLVAGGIGGANLAIHFAGNPSPELGGEGGTKESQSQSESESLENEGQSGSESIGSESVGGEGGSESDGENALEDFIAGATSGIRFSTVNGESLYRASPNLGATSVRDSVTDGVYTYFFLHLGRVERVPLYQGEAVYHNGRAALSYSIGNADGATVEDCIAAGLEKTVICSGMRGEFVIACELTEGKERKFDTLSERAQKVAMEEFALGLDAAEASSLLTAQGFVSDVTSAARTQEICIGKDMAAGYYSYTVSADLDVYAIVVCTRGDVPAEERAYAIKTVALPKDGTYREDFAYAEGRVAEPIPVDFFQPTDMDGMNVYAYWKHDIKPTVSVVLENSERKLITERGGWGLEQPQKDDVLDLSEFSEFLTEDYILRFEVTLNVKEKDNGYQEAYLYDRQIYVEGSAGEYEREQVEAEFGLLAGGSFESGSSAQDHQFTWEIDGDRCAETMYIRYDAHGDYDDDWYRNSISVTVSVLLRLPTFQ